MLAESPADWLEAFRQLAADRELRERMSTASRLWVEHRYSLRSALPVLTDLIQRAVAVHPN